jgi:HAD superfamily hydrolase (TIGR01484 family)
LKIGAIFSDYDGTLSFFDVNRDNALIPLPLYETVRRISKIVPLCVISTKTIGYLEQKMDFCSAIVGIGGLEYKINDRINATRVPAYKKKSLELMFNYALSTTNSMNGIILEEKRTTVNELLGFTVDWRLSENWNHYRNAMNPLIQKATKEGLAVITYRDHPFFDVYVTKPDKGKALQRLKRELKIKDKILYLGDSENDNPAFEKSDISIGITRKEVKPLLKCKYLLHHKKLNLFLKRLIQNKMVFDPVFLQLKRNLSYK